MYLFSSSSSSWLTVPAMTTERTEVMIISTIRPTAMPTIFLRIDGRNIHCMGARSVWPGQARSLSMHQSRRCPQQIICDQKGTLSRLQRASPLSCRRLGSIAASSTSLRVIRRVVPQDHVDGRGKPVFFVRGGDLCRPGLDLVMGVTHRDRQAARREHRQIIF